MFSFFSLLFVSARSENFTKPVTAPADIAKNAINTTQEVKLQNFKENINMKTAENKNTTSTKLPEEKVDLGKANKNSSSPEIHGDKQAKFANSMTRHGKKSTTDVTDTKVEKATDKKDDKILPKSEFSTKLNKTDT